MNKRITNKLLKKYPKLLPNLRSNTCEIEDGWQSLISNMLEELQSYIDNPTQDANLNSFHYWWNRRWYEFVWPIVSDNSFKQNWPSLVKFAEDKLRFEYYTKHPVEQVEIMIIKSKFGQLRIQGISGGNNTTRDIIKFYEKMSLYTCEACGTTIGVKLVTNKDKWEKTLCPDCAKQFKLNS